MPPLIWETNDHPRHRQRADRRVCRGQGLAGLVLGLVVEIAHFGSVWEGLEGTYGLPDPDDEHVVAAAVVAGGGAIITHNLRHFSLAKLPAGIRAFPDEEDDLELGGQHRANGRRWAVAHRLTADDLQGVVDGYRAGKTAWEPAERFEISTSNVTRLLRRPATTPAPHSRSTECGCNIKNLATRRG